MRPEVKAGPIERNLRPLNVGVDIGSRGVGDSAGDGVGLDVGDATGDAAGRAGGSCATTPRGSSSSIEIKDNAHEDMDINSFLFSCNRDGACRDGATD